MSHATSDLPVVLIVDDRKNMLRLMAKVLKFDARVLTADSGGEAIRILGGQHVDVVLCDLCMPDLDGIEVLKLCKKLRAQTEFVLMTAFASVGTAVDALRMGAYDYLTKPFEPEAARAVVLRAIGRAVSSSSVVSDETDGQMLPDMVGQSGAMRELSHLVRQVADSDTTVLLLGETGTGKERVARAVHRLSPRASTRFVAVNCAAIPTELMESELFGYARGAFTGAANSRSGLFEEADGGTLFLDEIGEMRLSLQAKLTRVLEERAIRRLGESSERRIDVRLIAATHCDIESMVKNQTFRADLWYRLNVATVRLPALRDRKDDIEPLAAHFLRERPPVRGRRIVGFTQAAIDAMLRFDWPGNVRQLRSAIERASVVGMTERIDVGDLPPEVAGVSRGKAVSDLTSLTWAAAQKQGQLDVARQYLESVLRLHHGQVSEAAVHAGVERESFYRLLRRYRVQAEVYRGKH